MAKIAVYPGSFDPVTNGHLDIIERALNTYDKVIVAVLENRAKRGTFEVEERLQLLRAATKGLRGVEVDSFSGLLVDYMRKRKVNTAIRGLRALSDLEYEFQMASMNRRLYPGMDTVFLMPDDRWTYLSSTIVREVASMGGDVSALVPKAVVSALKKR